MQLMCMTTNLTDIAQKCNLVTLKIKQPFWYNHSLIITNMYLPIILHYSISLWHHNIFRYKYINNFEKVNLQCDFITFQTLNPKNSSTDTVVKYYIKCSTNFPFWHWLLLKYFKIFQNLEIHTEITLSTQRNLQS